MIFYLTFIILISILLLFNAAQKNNLFFMFILAIIVFVAGFRLNVGYDSLNYQYIYSNVRAVVIEPFFVYSVNLLNLITPNPQIMFFIFSLVTIIFIVGAIKKLSDHVGLSLLLYLLIPGLFINSFSIIRQGLAIAILFYALSCLIKRQKGSRSVLLSITAVLFHYTAIIPASICLLLNKLFRKNYRYLVYSSILALSFVLYFIKLPDLMLSFLGGKYTLYSQWKQSTSLLKIAGSNITLLFLLLNKKRLIDSSEDAFMFNIMFVGTLILNVFSDYMPVTRLVYYFSIFQIILIPKLIFSFKQRQNRMFLLIAVLVFYFSMFINSLRYDESLTQYPKMTPYRNYLIERIL